MQASDPNQEFLVSELRTAINLDTERDDSRNEKLVFLHYHQAMLQALLEFTPCEQDVQKDMTLLKARARRMLEPTKNYIMTVDVLPYDRVKNLLGETPTLFKDIKDLCANCHAALPHLILAKFKELRQAPR
jgi:hypothetical protein